MFSKVSMMLIALLVGSATYFLLGPSLSGEQKWVISVATTVTTLWIFEVFPLYISALIGSFLLLLGGDFTQKEIFSPYFDPVIVLFLGGFMLARALQKHGLDKLIAHFVLQRTGGGPYVFLLVMMAVTAFLSMWMSNTASAAIMMPVCISVLNQNEAFSKDINFSKAAILGVAYAATLGGIGSLVGSPPNALAYKFLNDTQYSLSFLGWMLKTLPFVILSIILAWVVLVKINPPRIKRICFDVPDRKPGRSEFLVLGIFVFAAIGWLSTKLTGLSPAMVALLVTILLFAFGALDDEDLPQIPWGTLLLFGGGLSLGTAMVQIGIDDLLAGWLKIYLATLPHYLVIFTLIFFAMAVTMVISNTAAAAVMIPLIIPIATMLGLDVQDVVILIAVGTSLDFMMPVGTPPSAIAYSTGQLKVTEMIKNGVLINLGTGVLLGLLFLL